MRDFSLRYDCINVEGFLSLQSAWLPQSKVFFLYSAWLLQSDGFMPPYEQNQVMHVAGRMKLLVRILTIAFTITGNGENVLIRYDHRLVHGSAVGEASGR